MSKYILILLYFISFNSFSNELRPSSFFKYGSTVFKETSEIENYLKSNLPEGEDFKMTKKISSSDVYYEGSVRTGFHYRQAQQWIYASGECSSYSDCLSSLETKIKTTKASSVNNHEWIQSVSFSLKKNSSSGFSIDATIYYDTGSGINDTLNKYSMGETRKSIKLKGKEYQGSPDSPIIINAINKDSCQINECGNPINIYSGAKIERVTDIDNSKLPFLRYYNSLAGESKSNMGQGWSHNYSDFWKNGILYSYKGGEIYFNSLGISEDGGNTYVDKTSTSEIVYYENDTIKFFNANSGLLTKIKTPESLIFIERDLNNNIKKVYNNFGENLNFILNEKNMISQIYNEKINLNYDYDYQYSFISEKEKEPNLISVSNNEHFTYYKYEDSNFKSLLTSLIDSNNIEYSKWAYNSNGQGIQSEHHDGYNKTLLEISGKNSYITDSKNAVERRQLANYYGKIYTSRKYNKGDSSNYKKEGVSYNGGIYKYTTYELNGLYIEKNNENYNNQTKEIKIHKNDHNGELLEHIQFKYTPMKLLSGLNSRSKNISSVDNGTTLTEYIYNLNNAPTEIKITDKTTGISKSSFIKYKDYNLELPTGSPSNYEIFPLNGEITVTPKIDPITGDFIGGKEFCIDGQECNVINTGEISVSSLGLSYPIVIDGFRDDVNDFTYIDYDNMGNVTAIKEANCHTVSSIDDYYEGMSENAECNKAVFGSFTSERKPQYVSINGKVINITYDSRGNITSKTETKNGASSVTTYEWDNVDQLTKVTYPDGSWVSYEINGARYVEAINNSKGERVEFTLNKMGQAEIVTIKNSKGVIVSTTTYEWGLNEKVKSVTTGEGFKTTYEYDVMDKLIKYTDHLGNVYTLERDVLGDIVKEIDPLNGAISKEFQDKKLASVTDQNGNKTTFDMDAFGIVNTMTSPDSGITTYDNYGNGLVKSVVKGTNAVNINYSKDETNRLTKITNHIGGYHFAVKRDELSRITEIKSDKNLIISPYSSTPEESTASVEAHGGSINMTYDDFNNVTQLTETVDTVLFTTTNTFDTNGRKTKTITPSGATIDYTLDANGQIKDIDYSKNGFSTNVISNVDYYYGNLVGSYCMSNGINASFDYNTDLAIKNVSYKGTQTYFDESYIFEKGNQISNITDNLNSSNSQTFTYDKKSQLTNAIGAYGTISYTIDAVGNRTEKVDLGVSDAYVIDGASNKVLSTSDRTFEYDELGNIIKDNTTEIVYDSMNRPSSVTVDGVTTHYVYNALNQRVKVNNNHYIYNEHKQLVYLEDGDKIIEFIYLNGFKVAMVIDDGISINIYYAHNNYQGLPRQFSDANQLIVWSGQFKPYGEVYDENADISNIIRFTGQYKDMNTNYIYNYFRDYDSSLGRYIQSDPIGLNGGINTYSYVLNNPVNYIDPFGLATCFYFIGSHEFRCISNDGETAVSLDPNGVHSGVDNHRNNPSSTNVPSKGPIPVGEYNILWNQSATDEHEGKPWWELQEKGWNIMDDFLFKYKLKRGAFNLHFGTTSHGCITVNESLLYDEYNKINDMLSVDEGRNELIVYK